MSEFDSTKHLVVPVRGFEGLRLGEIFRAPSRTITEANFAAFQTVSLDNHPIHYDEEYCKRLGYSAPLAHGLQVLAFTAAGAGLFPHVVGESLIGFIEVLSSVFGYGRWSEAAVFAALVLVLIFRPTGILGQQVADRA